MGAHEGAIRIFEKTNAFFKSQGGQNIIKEIQAPGHIYTHDRLVDLLLNGYILNDLQKSSPFRSFYSSFLNQEEDYVFGLGAIARDILITEMPIKNKIED